MTPSHGGVNVSVFSGAIKMLDKSFGPKMIGDDGGRSQAFWAALAELQRTYIQLDDDAEAIKRRKVRKIKKAFKEAEEGG